MTKTPPQCHNVHVIGDPRREMQSRFCLPLVNTERESDVIILLERPYFREVGEVGNNHHHGRSLLGSDNNNKNNTDETGNNNTLMRALLLLLLIIIQKTLLLAWLSVLWR